MTLDKTRNRACLQGVYEVVAHVVRNALAQQAAFIRRVESIRILRRLGPAFLPKGGPLFRRQRSLLLVKKMCLDAGISSRKGESSVRCSARNSQKAELRNRHFDSSLCTGALIDALPTDRFNPNKEIGRDSS
jgi:hypothetical protein